MRWVSTIKIIATLAVFARATAGAADLSPGHLSPNEVAAARRINLTKCGKCHKLYQPTDYSIADWDKWMAKMAKKSKLKPQQTSLLNQYFELRRAGVIPEEKRQK